MTGEEIAVEFAHHDDRLVACESGVSNFRKFSAKMDRKIGFVYGVTWFAGIMGVVFIAVFSWFLTLIVPASKVILDDYYRNHPSTKIQSSAPGAIQAQYAPMRAGKW